MDVNFATSHWALLLAILLLVLVVIVVLWQVFGRTRFGQLRRARAVHARAVSNLRSASAATAKAATRLEKLQGRAATSRPRHLQEAEGALQDARMLEKIADDKHQVARNHVRRVIYEEYPPTKHARLRKKYLGEEESVEKPFSF